MKYRLGGQGVSPEGCSWHTYGIERWTLALRSISRIIPDRCTWYCLAMVHGRTCRMPEGFDGTDASSIVVYGQTLQRRHGLLWLGPSD